MLLAKKKKRQNQNPTKKASLTCSEMVSLPDLLFLSNF